MYKICLYLLVITLCAVKTVFSQTNVVADTLTPLEIKQVEAGFKRSTFYAFYMADSFSRRKDTLHASEWFLKIDPFYFLTGLSNAAHADSFLHRYRLSEDVKAAYREMYQAVISTPRTEDYLLMKQMRDEDQDVRRKLENCGDSFTCSILRIKMIRTDSTHFETLYKYVQEKGWPDMSNGSMYAALIAIHNGSKAAYFVPFIKQAISVGKLPFEPLQLIFAKMKHSNTSFADLQRHIDTSIKFSFVVNEILNHQLPYNIDKIKKVIKKYYPNVQLLLVYEKAVKNDNHIGWQDKEWALKNSKNGNGMGSFHREILRDFPLLQRRPLPENTSNLAVYYMPTERMWDRMMFYVILKK